MMCNRVFGFHVGLRSGIFAGAILVAVGVTPVHAQSGDPISPPANTAGATDSTPSPDHVRKPTEPPPFDPNRSAARAARVKAKPPAAPAPESDAVQPPAPVSRSTARQRWIDPWAEPATAPTPVSRSTTRRRSEPAKVVGVDSFGRSSEDQSPEPSPAARPQRGARPGAEAAPAETTDEALPR